MPDPDMVQFLSDALRSKNVNLLVEVVRLQVESSEVRWIENILQ